MNGLATEQVTYYHVYVNCTNQAYNGSHKGIERGTRGNAK